MKKPELLNILLGKTSKIEHYIDLLENEKDEKLFLLKETLLNVKATLSEIKNDIEKDIVPENFYVKIYSILFQVYIEENETPTGISWESFKEKLLDINLNRLISINLIYKFYKDLNFISDNTVVIGANGSGKSILASTIKNNFSEKITIVIPAQKLLIIPTFDSIPSLEKAMSDYKNFETDTKDTKTTYISSQYNTLPYEEVNKYILDYQYILSTLFAEKISIQDIIYKDFKKKDGFSNMKQNNYPYIKLEKAINIWNFLIEHREMFYDDNNLKIKVKGSSEEYPAYKMSDGEKNIFFLIGRVLLASDNAIIIIDEPEMYLHKAIINKLWDRLEYERCDCKFIYLTHDLEFADSRNANKYWIKDFQFPIKWEIEPIPENDIPDSLLMKILGSRKKILFCEGTRSSLDFQIYEILFPNYTITPVESCSNVINYTRAFNKIPNKNSTAIGIVDRDFRTDAQINKFYNENIYVYSVAEIENLFLLEDFIQIFAKNKKERIDIKKIKERVLDRLEKDKELQISNYITSYINYVFSREHMKKGNNKQGVKDNFHNFITKIEIDNLYDKRKEEIEKIINEKDYSKALKVYNNKGLLKEIGILLTCESGKYSVHSLKVLKDLEEARQVLRAVFPQEVTNA
jgi:hypothetical protein